MQTDTLHNILHTRQRAGPARGSRIQPRRANESRWQAPVLARVPERPRFSCKVFQVAGIPLIERSQTEVPMSNRLSGKVAFITGANKGIGLETARGLGKLGFAIVLGSRDEARCRAAADKLRSEGIDAVEAVRFDVTRAEDHEKVARDLEDRYGRLEVLVNKAGVK